MFPLRNKTTDPTIIILKSNLYDALNIYKMNCFFFEWKPNFFFHILFRTVSCKLEKFSQMLIFGNKWLITE